MTRPLGVILAGGQATRMGGGDKGRLGLGNGHTLFDEVIQRLGAQVDAMAINANGDASRFADLGLPVLQDSIAEFLGPLAGVLAGLDWAAEQGANSIVSVAADTPFFPRDLVQRFMEASEDREPQLSLASSFDVHGKLWRQPTFGLWPVALRDDLRAALKNGLRKVVVWTDQHNAREVVFKSQPFDPFFNVNTPEDLRKAQDLMRDAL